MEKFDNIFLIDDDDIINFISMKILTQAGIAKHIAAFSNAPDALNMIKDRADKIPDAITNDLIFLDINMPEMDGWAFLDLFEQLPEHITRNYKIIMLSSSINPKDIEQSTHYKSVCQYISKPLSIDKINIL